MTTNTTDSRESFSEKLWNLEIGSMTKKDGERILRYLDTNTINTIMQLADAYAHQREVGAKVDGIKGSLNRLNKAIFFSTTQPDGQFVKDCILAELDMAENERLAQLTTQHNKTEEK